MENTRRILSIGAHPDDADTSASGLLMKLHDAGWQVRLLSLTDGSAGTYNMDLSRQELALTRRAEAAASGAILGGRYDVLGNPDGQLMPTLENREALIRYIRLFRPDVIVTNRPNDYHADHRNTALLVQDASFLLTVPRICEDVRYLEHTPAIMFWSDGFKKPYPHQSDIFVPVSQARIDELTKIATCHACQYFDWMYWPDRTEKMEWPREKQIEDLRARFMRGAKAQRDDNEAALIKKYGKAAADKITYLETFELSEYGEEPTEEFLKIVERAE